MPCRPLSKATEADVVSSASPVPDGGAPHVPIAMAAVHCDEAPKRPAGAPGSLTRAVMAARDERAESWILCSAMTAFALAWLAWSQPLPSVRDLTFVVLCMALVLIERRQAKARLRKAAALAGCSWEAACQVVSRGGSDGSACQDPDPDPSDSCVASRRHRAAAIGCPRRSASPRRRPQASLRLHAQPPAARAARGGGRRRRRGAAWARHAGAAARGALGRRPWGTGPSGNSQGRIRRSSAPKSARRGRDRRFSASKGALQGRIRRPAASKGVLQGRIRRPAASKGIPQGRIRRSAASSRG